MLIFHKSKKYSYNNIRYFRCFYRKHGIRIIQKPPGNSTLFYQKDSFDNFSDDKSRNLLQHCIENNIAWSVAEGLPDKENKMLLLSSRTPLQKELTIESITQSKITYLTTILKIL